MMSCRCLENILVVVPHDEKKIKPLPCSPGVLLWANPVSPACHQLRPTAHPAARCKALMVPTARLSFPALVFVSPVAVRREQFIYALGPIAHMQENSKYFSSKPCPRPAVMPRVTIQMPVSKGRATQTQMRSRPSHEQQFFFLLDTWFRLHGRER